MASDQADTLESFKVLLIDEGPTSRLELIASRISARIPGLTIRVGTLGTAEESVSGDKPGQALLTKIQEADLIIGSWQIAAAGGLNKTVTQEISDAVVQSSTRKLITPNWYQGWDWVGVEHWSDDALEDQVIRAIKQIVEDDDVRMAKPLGVGAIIGIIIGILFLLLLLSIPVSILLMEGLY